MSIGASERRTFVRAKARFAGEKARQRQFIRRNAVFTGHIAMYRWRHFRQSRLCHHGLHKLLWHADITDGVWQGMSVTPGAVGMRSEMTTHGRVWRKMPRAPCPSRSPSVRPARSHSLPVERHLPGLMQHPPLPGVSLFRRFCCYLDRPPAPHGSLRHPSPPGVSRFQRFRCDLNRPPAPQGLLRHPPLPGVSRFWRIGSHLRRVTRYPALWQRPPAPDAPLKRGISFAKTRRFRAADYSPRPAPVRGTFAVAWNIAVRTRGVFTHRTGFQKLACAERGLVRTGWRGGEAACGNRWR